MSNFIYKCYINKKDKSLINMSKKVTTEDFIKKAILVHGEGKFNYSKVNYVSAKTKVTIICDKGHEFEQMPSNHTHTLNKRGCPICNGGIKYTKEEFITKAIAIHGNKYKYDGVFYINSGTKVSIYCKIHNEYYTQVPESHLNGCGCPKCKYTDSNLETFIQKAIKKHGNKYDYSKVIYVSSKDKVIIICDKGHEFEQTPVLHVNKSGCPKCALNNMGDTQEDFIKKAKLIHGNKFDYNKVCYISARTPIIIICENGHEFKQKPCTHLKSGCDTCNNIKRKCTTEEFIERAIKIHDNDYDYSKSICTGITNKVTIICKKGHAFEQLASSHLLGCGCTICKETKGEKYIRKVLCKYNIEFKSQYRILPERYRYDFYIPSLNTIIEFDGKQHYEPVNIFKGEEGYLKTKKRDLAKNNICNLLGINLIRIPHYDVNNIEDMEIILKKALNI